jgi:23S rRNA pseudouridine1911/1915/1917 synthase
MITEYEFIVSENEKGIRADKFLSSKCTDISRRQLQEAIKSGALLIDGSAITNPDYKLKINEKCYLSITHGKHNEDSAIKPKQISLDIVFEDEYLLVINKQSGLTVHPGAGNHEDTLINGLAFYYSSNLAQYKGLNRLGLVHRLDRDTSGLLLIAKNESILYKLSRALAKREIKRHYLALVYGNISNKYGKVETLVDRCPYDRVRMAVNHTKGKRAVTHYTIKKSFENLSLVECQLETGRTHQIRLHMEHIKHPIVGDQVYGRHLNFNLNSYAKEVIQKIMNFPRQALHAYKLEFTHPVTCSNISLHSPLPNDISELIELLVLKN